MKLWFKIALVLFIIILIIEMSQDFNDFSSNSTYPRNEYFVENGLSYTVANN